jgi:hypothetical protein
MLGIGECLKHNLAHGYPVLYERDAAATAHFKFTVLLMPAGTLKITGLPLPALTTDKAVEPDIAAVLATEPYVKGGKKKAAEGGAAEGGAAAGGAGK